MENLGNQKATLAKLFNMQKDTNINLIKFNSQIASLHTQTNKLINQIQYNYVSSFILKNTKQSTKELYKLNSLIAKFNKKSQENFKLTSGNINLESSQKKLKQLSYSIFRHIDSIILKSTFNDAKKFNIFYKFFILLLSILLITTFWYKIRLTNIYKDILSLYSASEIKKNRTIFSQEVTDILLTHLCHQI